MEETMFEQAGGTYQAVGDYFIPNLSLPETEERPVGVWGNRRKVYLKNHHRILYYNLLTSCKLNEHLADVEEQAEALFSRLVKDLAEKEDVNEQLKADNALEWVQRMNDIRNRATEIVNSEIIYV